MKRIACLSVIFGILVLLVAQCTRRPMTGWGDDADIHILADSLAMPELQPIMSEIFEKRLITPQTESLFTIYPAEVSQEFRRYKNLIFFATLDSDGPVSEIVKSNLSEQAMQKVVNEETFLFQQTQKWAKDQLILFLIAPNLDRLKERIKENKQQLFELVDDYWLEVSASRLFQANEQVKLSEELAKKNSWKIRIPYDYQVFIDKPDSNFIMFRRMLPERWLFVNWQEADDPTIVTPEWILSKRDRIGRSFYGGDIIEQKFVQPEIDTVDFLGRRAIRVVGLWRNDIKEAGGPFRSYTFYDETHQRIYMLDYALFQPRLKDKKRGYLRQGEAIMRTFQTNTEFGKGNK